MLIAAEITQYYEKLVRACEVAGLRIEGVNRLKEDLLCIALCSSEEQVREVIVALQKEWINPVVSWDVLGLEWLPKLYYVAVPASSYPYATRCLPCGCGTGQEEALQRALDKHIAARRVFWAYSKSAGLVALGSIAVLLGAGLHYSVAHGMIMYALVFGASLLVIGMAGCFVLRNRESN